MDEINQDFVKLGGFFRRIKQDLGIITCKKAKDLMRCYKKLSLLKNRRIFLLRCRSSGIIPLHIFNKVDYIYTVCLDDHPFKTEVSNILLNTRNKMLKLEIKITIWKIGQLLGRMEELKNDLQVVFSEMLWTQTLNEFLRYYDNNFKKIRKLNQQKFTKLRDRMVVNVTQDSKQRIYNYTNVDLPDKVQEILNLDSNFGLPTLHQNLPVVSIIKDLEGCVSRVKDDQLSNDQLMEWKNNLRARGVNVVTNYIKDRRSNMKNQKRHSLLLNNIKATKKFLAHHKEVVVMRSDKGNSTVVMHREEYRREMNKLVNDTKTYRKTGRDPTSRFQDLGNKLIKNLVEKKFIDELVGKRMSKLNTLPPRIYGLRKTHKPGCKMRPVVSSIGSPSYEIAKFLHEVLSPYVASLKYGLKDSFEFIDKLQGIRLTNNYILISLDVVSLFTNVHKDLINQIIEERWDVIREYVKLDKETLLELINYCFDSGYFIFEGNYYLQEEGCAMGSPASPSIAMIGVDYVIEKALTKLSFDIPVLTAYVDDLFMTIPADKSDIILTVFNSIDSKIQFTLEEEVSGKLPYLDVLVWRTEEGSLVTSWFRKSYNSGRILNYNSNHPLSQKLGVVQGFLNRAIRLSHDSKVEESVDMVRRLLLSNNYPISTIRKCEKITSERIKNKIGGNTNRLQWSFSRFPYVCGLSPRIGNLFRQTNCKLVFYNISKVKNLYSQLKDKIKKEDRSSLVYRIPCSCGRWYVGQTRQKLKKRTAQHKSDCRIESYNKNNKTALAVHHFENEGHNFQFDKVEILDLESNFLKRNISEMIYIKALNCVNFRSDAQGLSTVYSDLINGVRLSMD